MEIEDKVKEKSNTKKWESGKYKWYDILPTAGFITFQYRNQKREIEGHFMSPFEFVFYSYHGLSTFTGLMYLASVVNN